MRSWLLSHASLAQRFPALQWTKGKQQGYGKQIFANGTMCLGQFGRSGRLDGFGACLYPSGDVYEGEVMLLFISFGQCEAVGCGVAIRSLDVLGTLLEVNLPDKQLSLCSRSRCTQRGWMRADSILKVCSSRTGFRTAVDITKLPTTASMREALSTAGGEELVGPPAVLPGAAGSSRPSSVFWQSAFPCKVSWQSPPCTRFTVAGLVRRCVLLFKRR